MDRRVKTRHISVFVEIARKRSLKQAAEVLNLTQPAVSKTLAELEGILKTTLLLRNRSGVSLTPAGEVFLHFAGQSLAALHQGINGVAQLQAGTQGQLSIGVLPSVAARLMPRAVAGFRAMAPDVVLTLSDGSHDGLIARLRNGELDLLVGRLGAPESMQGLSFTQLYTEIVDFVVRPGHPLLEQAGLESLPDWPVIYPKKNAAIRPLVDRFLIANGIGVLPQRIESVSGAFGREFTRNSDAVWVISAGVVAREVAEGRLARLDIDTSLTRGPIGISMVPERASSPAVFMMQTALRDTVAELAL